MSDLFDDIQPGYELTKPVAFNDADWVVGQVGEVGGFWDGDTTRTVPNARDWGHPGKVAVGSVATAINNFGDITGRLIDTATADFGLPLTRGFAMYNVAPHQGPLQEVWVDIHKEISPYAINDRRWIVGTCTLPDMVGSNWNCLDCRNGFWFQRISNSWPWVNYGVYEVSDPEFGEEEIPVRFDTPVHAINDKLTMAGSYNGLFLAHYSIGTYFGDTLCLRSLPPPAGFGGLGGTFWYDINEHDDVVGRVGQHGIAVVNRLAYNLNCTSDLPPGAVITEARGITDSGKIIANGTVGGVARGFVLGSVVTDVEDEPSIRSLPQFFALHQNYPNPFNPVTTIEYSIPARSQVTIEIFNVLGQKVRTLVNESKSAGEYRIEWSGADESGRSVSTGVYLYRFQAGDIVQTKKMLLMK